MTENAHARITREEAAALAGRSVRQISRWAAAGKVSVVYENRGGKLYATFDRTEVLAAAGKPVPHRGGNAEDCPACHDPNPPYPFLCQGTNRALDGS